MAVGARYTEQLVIMVSPEVKRAIRERSDARQVSDAVVVRPYLEAGLASDPLGTPSAES